MRSQSQWHPLIALLGVGGVMSFFGCHLILGVDEFSADGCPAPETTRCNGNTFEICDVNGEWRIQKECTLGCTADGCIDCDVGVIQCDYSNNTVLSCQQNLQWLVTPCENQTCVNGQCVGICEPGNKCVDDFNVQACVGGYWVTNGMCPVDKPCQDGVCHECNDGEARCNGQIAETCVNSAWYAAKDCLTTGTWGSVCSSGECVGECSAGIRRCIGDSAQTCSAIGRWTSVDCADQYRICDPATGTCSGECNPTSAPTCAGNVRKSCDMSAHWIYDDCGATSTCVAGMCVANCGPASKRCQGNLAQGCDDAGNWVNVSTCSNGCFEGTCTRPTCSCGPSEAMDCCSSPRVPGGTFERGNAYATTATISAFRLDAHEITVGRFRKFVSAYDPALFVDGVGANPNVVGSGWKSAWNAQLPTNADLLKTTLACHATSTWTTNAGENEDRPLNCLSWYEAFAFCIWDGGFLPTEAEWNFAAAGGSDQREYPWSTPAPNTTIDLGRAVFQCLQAGTFDYNDCFLGQLPTVGSRSPAGDGKFGHKDLAGSLFEWTMDVYGQTYPNGDNCQNCANVNDVASSTRVLRGGGWNSTASMLYSHARAQLLPTQRQWFVGARCARGI